MKKNPVSNNHTQADPLPEEEKEKNPVLDGGTPEGKKKKKSNFGEVD